MIYWQWGFEIFGHDLSKEVNLCHCLNKALSCVIYWNLVTKRPEHVNMWNLVKFNSFNATGLFLYPRFLMFSRVIERSQWHEMVQRPFLLAVLKLFFLWNYRFAFILLFICLFVFRWHKSIILGDYKGKSKHTNPFQFFVIPSWRFH